MSPALWSSCEGENNQPERLKRSLLVEFPLVEDFHRRKLEIIMAGNSEIKEEYTSSLADLTFNSKPLISVLTILAEENLAHAKDIVEAIEAHLSRVRTEVKLPVLYLIDCIIKNVGGAYTSLFCQNIVSTFCSVFEQVDERTRAEMFRLRQTWNDVLPPKKLYALDVQIAHLDPAWPVTAPPPSSIHFNPKFLKNTVPNTTTVDQVKSDSTVATTPTATGLDPKTINMQQKLIDKQRQLLELQQKKLELELLRTQVKLQEQLKNQTGNALPASVNSAVTIPATSGANVPVTQNLLLKPEVAKQLALSTCTDKIAAHTTVARNKLGTNTVSSVVNTRLQNNQTAHLPKIPPAQTNLMNVRPIRDPRLLRHQQQHQQQLQTPTPPVTVNNIVEFKTQPTVESDNKVINSKTNVRNDRLEPRLVNNKSNIEPHGKSRTSPHPSPPKYSPKTSSPRKSTKFSSSKSSSSSSDLTDSKGSSTSLGSPSKTHSDSPSKSRSSKSKPRKKGRDKEKDSSSDKERYDKADMYSRDFNDKKSGDKHSKSSKSDKEKLRKSDFKELKGSTKNRNYVRRNRDSSISPDLSYDVDLRHRGPPEKQPRIQGDIVEEKNGSSEMAPQTQDVDLRQFPAVIGKKRTSTETQESPSSKKTKSEMFDVLFGSEDIDLRQLPPVFSPNESDRPPTPPPPIISDKSDKIDNFTKDRREPDPNLQAVRAKLANAVGKDKSKDKESGDLQQSPLKVKLNRSDIRDKIIISPADEECIKAGNMTKAQETALMQKIIAQIETQKLREAKRKESESLGNISLQPISDDELDADLSGSDSEDDYQRREDKDDRHQDGIEDEYWEKGREDNKANNHGNQMDDGHNKFQRMEFRDPRRPRIWRGPGGGRARVPKWDMPPVPMMRPGMRPPIRPGLEPWMRPPGPLPDKWRAMAPPPPPMYNNFDMMHHVPPPHVIDPQGRNSPSSQDIPVLQYSHPDSYKFITIDGEPREIRYYDETAIVFMNPGDPREITFHDGTRRIYFDGEPYTLKLNHPYEEISLKNNIHRVRLGAPSREIFIDGNGYECYFDNNEKTIELDGNKIIIKLEPPPPQVKIGAEKRLDLVAGKIQLVIDAKHMFTIFLDAKSQTFILHGQTHTLKFVDALQVVLIDDTRFEVEFGSLPKPLVLNGKKHFIRFSVLPKGIKLGQVDIKGMEGSKSVQTIQDEIRQEDQAFNQTALEQEVPLANQKVIEVESPDRNSNSPHHFQTIIQQQNLNNLDLLSSVMASSMVPSSCEGGYMVENNADSQQEQQISDPAIVPVVPSPAKPPPPVLNINELFQRLVATGIVTTVVSQPEEPPALPKSKAHDKFKNLKPAEFTKSETLKIRRTPLIQMLYAGMQCSSCGMRFPPEQSMYYTQHLDWHFRQNRKGKKNIRKASSRRWYYSLTDWTNYQEIEDLEEREKNYFENQNLAEGGMEDTEDDIEIPCVSAGPDVQMAVCEVCQDRFEQFYNEEKDEWQLRMAVRVDDKIYHPLCYEDYQASLVEIDERRKSQEAEGASSSIPLLEVEEEAKEEENFENDEDDVMEVIENIDDDEHSPKKVESDMSNTEQEEDDDDVILNEVAPIKIVVDDDDDEKMDENDAPSEASDGLIPGVVVKEEPIDDGFIDVGSGLVKMKSDIVKIKTEPVDNDEIEAPPEPTVNPSETADTTHIEVVSTIDGNVEMEAGSLVPAGTNIGSKIKINITKPIPAVAVPKETRDVTLEELQLDNIDPNEPPPPGEEPVQLNIKPALKGLDLKRQQVVKKGSELTGLCSIM